MPELARRQRPYRSLTWTLRDAGIDLPGAVAQYPAKKRNKNSGRKTPSTNTSTTKENIIMTTQTPLDLTSVPAAGGHATATATAAAMMSAMQPALDAMQTTGSHMAETLVASSNNCASRLAEAVKDASYDASDTLRRRVQESSDACAKELEERVALLEARSGAAALKAEALEVAAFGLKVAIVAGATAVVAYVAVNVVAGAISDATATTAALAELAALT